MSRRSEYGRRLKQLMNRLKREGGRPTMKTFSDPVHLLLFAILSNHASEQRASSAVHKLLESIVDINELRVTPVATMVEMIGSDVPGARSSAEEIARSLNAIFNRTHALDLSFLKKSARKAAEAFLDSLDGIGPYAKAMMLMRCVGAHAIPLDGQMVSFLARTGCIPADASHEEAQRLVSTHVHDKDAELFYGLLKRYASTHVGPAPEKKAQAEPAPVAEPAVAPSAPERKPGSKAAKSAARPPAKSAAKGGGKMQRQVAKKSSSGKAR